MAKSIQEIMNLIKEKGIRNLTKSGKDLIEIL